MKREGLRTALPSINEDESMEKAGVLRVTIMTGQSPKNANKMREVFLPPF